MRGGESHLYLDDDNALFLCMIKDCARSIFKTNEREAEAFSRILDALRLPDNAHLLVVFRQLAVFAGYLYVICSLDAEAAHHLVFTMTCIAYNVAQKLITVLVGTSGNNGKSEYMKVMKKGIFGSNAANIQLSVLREVRDGSAHSGGLVPVLGNCSVLIADEAGIDTPSRGDANSKKGRAGILVSNLSRERTVAYVPVTPSEKRRDLSSRLDDPPLATPSHPRYSAVSELYPTTSSNVGFSHVFCSNAVVCQRGQVDALHCNAEFFMHYALQPQPWRKRRRAENGGVRLTDEAAVVEDSNNADENSVAEFYSNQKKKHWRSTMAPCDSVDCLAPPVSPQPIDVVRLAEREWEKPPSDGDVETLVALCGEGLPADEGRRIAIGNPVVRRLAVEVKRQQLLSG